MIPELQDLIDAGAIFYVSHSGGKDSQAMYGYVCERVPHAQVAVVHADLGEVEWEGAQEHIRANITHGLHVVRANKTFFDMVYHRAATRPDVPSFPSSATRQCTSDLKRGPIQKFIRNDLKRRGRTLAVNCVGLRAAESKARSKRPVWQLNKPLSVAGRTVYDWLPVHHLSTDEIFALIRERYGQEPFWIYPENDRMSCVFCVMACDNDLAHGRRHRPELYAKYIAAEQATGWTMFSGASLADRTRLIDVVQVEAPAPVQHALAF